MSSIVALFGDTKVGIDFNKMMECIEHRGVKKICFTNEKYALGVCELSQNDEVSIDNKLIYKDHVILFDGEIYNIDELMGKYVLLNSLNKKNHAKIFLALWVEYGEKFLTDINGQFSALIYNITNNKFIAIRDVLGIKPLYFAEEEGKYCFVSEVKALNELEWYKGNVKHVIPGCIYDGSEQKKYKSINFETYLCDEKDLTKKIYMLLEEAVERRVDRNGKTGVLLSGGIDSNIISYFAQKFGVNNFYTVGIDECEDINFAKQMPQYEKVNHVVKILNKNDIVDMIDDLIWHTENYNKYTIINGIPQYYAIKIAKEDGVEEILCGDGSDELFGGYDFLYNYYNYEELDLSLKNSLSQLHRTECMRFDRITMMNTIVGRAPFLDINLVQLAMAIIKELKFKDNTEKYILRKTFENVLPKSIILRKKNNFYRSTGMEMIIEEWAKNEMTDEKYSELKELYKDWKIRSKEELLFFLKWKEKFPKLFEKGANYFNEVDSSILNIGIDLKKII